MGASALGVRIVSLARPTSSYKSAIDLPITLLNNFALYFNYKLTMSTVVSPSVDLSSYRDQHFKVRWTAILGSYVL